MRRLVAPRLDLDADKVTAFEQTFASATRVRDGIDYQLSFPKQEFLRYLVAKHDVLLHGSGTGAIDVFEPVSQTDYFGRVRSAVFAASDGIWPMFFAILDRSRYHGSLRNNCYWDADAGGERQKFYAFSINSTFLAREPWREGTIYVLPRARFERVVDEDGSPSEEWLSTRRVTPIARLAVSPTDFPFLKDVEGHGDERTGRFEELAYELGSGAEDLSIQETAIVLVLTRPSLWRERVAEFVALLPAVLPNLRADILEDARGLALNVRGPGPDRDRLAVALQQWRRAISAT